MCNFSEPRVLGRSGLTVGRLGLASSYGGSAKGFEMAFERGCNYFYWGTYRRKGLGQAIRNLVPRHRDKMVVVLQSYSRLAGLLRLTYTRGLKRLGIDYADVLLLGWHNQPPSSPIMDAALELKRRGLASTIAVSCHDRPTFRAYIDDPRFDVIMVRYNAAHRGAEREVFPHLPVDPARRPGVVTYTSTRWGYLVNARYTPPGMKTPDASDCYRFALGNPNVDLCLTGPSSDEQLAENLKALEAGPLSHEETEWMKAVGDNVHRLTSRKALTNPFMQRTQ